MRCLVRSVAFLVPGVRRGQHGRSVYDALVEADITEHLHTTPERYELVVSTDVFIYVGDLDPVFAGRALS